MAGYEMKQRIFDKGPKDDSSRTSIRFTNDMYEALKEVADKGGFTIPELICDILEYHLTELANKGAIEWPKGYKKN